MPRASPRPVIARSTFFATFVAALRTALASFAMASPAGSRAFPTLRVTFVMAFIAVDRAALGFAFFAPAFFVVGEAWQDL